MTEIEVPNARIPIQSIDEVTRALIADAAVGDVEHAQGEAREYEEGQLTAASL